MYEIWSLGHKPFEGYTNPQVRLAALAKFGDILYIDMYCSLVSQRMSSLQSGIVDCSVPDCSSHHTVLDSYGSHLLSTLLSSALERFPTRSISTSHRRLVGWNQSVARLKQSSVFWYRIWEEAAAHIQGFSLKSRKVLKGDISMLFAGCCVGKMLCFKRS